MLEFGNKTNDRIKMKQTTNLLQTLLNLGKHPLWNTLNKPQMFIFES